LVAVMKASDFRNLDHPSFFGRLHRTRLRRILFQRQVCPGSVIIAEVMPHNSPQVLFPELDYVIQPFRPQASNYSLGAWLLQRTARRNDHFLNTECLHPILKRQPIHSIPIANQEARHLALAERLHDLLPVHSAVGCSGTLKCTIFRRSCARMIKMNSTRKVAVGTVKKSIDARSLMWLSRN